MLDQNDLKQIGELLEQKLEEKFEQKLEPIRQDIVEIKNDIVEIKKDVVEMKEDIYRVRQAVKRIEEDVKLLTVRVDKIAKMESEDVIAIDNDVGILKRKVAEIENKLTLLVPAHS